jgi:Uma2 family endonuclease
MHSKPAFFTSAEYLEWENQNRIKHEYVDGEVYAMSGAKRRHNLIAATVVRLSGNAAAERGLCQVFGSDMKVHVEAHNCFYYPDVSVCCDPNDRNELYLTRPCFIVEVTSPSTASIDRREKRASYATLESLREYAIIDQDQMRVELYRREATAWRGYLLNQPSDVLESSCLGLRITLEQIYAGVEFPPAGVSEPEEPDYVAATW